MTNQVSGRVVVDHCSYRNRSEFEDSYTSTAESVPYIRSDNYGSDREAYHVGCQCQTCASHPNQVRPGRFRGFDGLLADKDSPPDDETFYLVCSHRVFAFVLKDRTWGM